MNYKLVKGPDDTVWVSVQPLMSDVYQTLNKLQSVDTEQFSVIDKDILEFNILGLKAIHTFLEALIKESTTNEKTLRPTTH